MKLTRVGMVGSIRPSAALLALFVGLQAGCGSSELVTVDVNDDDSVDLSTAVATVVQGADQQGEVGAALSQPVRVRILSAGGDPLAGVSVEWVFQDGGVVPQGGSGTVSNLVTETNSSGETTATWELGTSAGTQRGSAYILIPDAPGASGASGVEGMHRGAKSDFSADADAGSVASIELDVDDVTLEPGESIEIETTVEDQWGNPIENADLSWASSDEDVATVEDGMVEVLSEGTATISAWLGSVSDEFTVYSEADAPDPDPDPDPSPEDPSRVTDLRVTSVTETTATVRWTGVTNGLGGAAKYLLRYGSPTLSWGSADDTDEIVTGVVVGGTGSHTWTNLTSGSDYEFQLVTYRGTLNAGATFGDLSNVAEGTTQTTDQEVASIVASPTTITLNGPGSVATVVATALTAGGVPVPAQFDFSSTNSSVASVTQSGLVSGVSTGTAMIEVTTPSCASCNASTVVVVEEGPPPPPPGSFHEPAGFTGIFDEPWDSFNKYDYWTNDNQPGSVVANGNVTWTYPAGFSAGYTAGSRVIRMDTPNHGPYQYNRDEGVVLSANWYGGPAGVNKFRFWSRTNEEIHGYLMFEGGGSGHLRPAINTQGFPTSTVVWRWDDSENLANPTEAQTRVTRGVPHTVETLMYKGTPGNSDGWVKVWLDGVLVLHFVNKALCASGDTARFGPIHYAPIWGGVGGTVPSTQTLSIAYSYASWGSSVN